jgi:transposase
MHYYSLYIGGDEAEAAVHGIYSSHKKAKAAAKKYLQSWGFQIKKGQSPVPGKKLKIRRETKGPIDDAHEMYFIGHIHFFIERFELDDEPMRHY